MDEVINGGEKIIEQLGLFDAQWYLENYCDAARSSLMPLSHYLTYGTKLGRWPCNLYQEFCDLADLLSDRYKAINDLIDKLANYNYALSETCIEHLLNGDPTALSEIKRKAIRTGEAFYRNLFVIARSKCHRVCCKMPSVLFISAGLKGPSPGGGIGTCFYNMIKCLKDQAVEVTVLYVAHPYYSKGDYSFWKKEYEEDLSVNFLALNCNNKDYGSKEMKRSYEIKNYLSRHEGLYDRVVFHDFYGLAYYTLLSKKLGLAFNNMEVFISAHGNHKLSYHFNSKKIADWSEHAILFMEKESLKMADKVTTPSVYYAQWLAQNLDVFHAECIPNIIEMEKVNLLFDANSYDGKSIFFYGRAERLKGIDVLLKALVLLDSEIEESLEFHVVGNRTKIDGVDSEEYILSSLNATKIQVSFEYNVSPPDFFKKVHLNHGLVIFPTLGETSSCVVVESILSNTPFLASDTDGIKELIHKLDQDKVLFRTGEVESLILSIRNAWTNGLEVPRLAFDMESNIARWQRFLTGSTTQASLSIKTGEEIGVTVIVPTSNRPQLLEETLGSLLNQDYKNFEIIVFDDASDNAELNESICKKLNIFYCFSPVKLYKGKACNTASQYSNKEYICFFDDDDLAKPDMLKKYNAAIKKDNTISIISCFAEVFEHAEYENSGEVLRKYASYSLGNSLKTNILANFFGKGTFLVRKDEFERVGGYEEDIAPVPMVDYRFYIKSCLYGANIRTVPFELYSYRKNSPKSLFYDNKTNKRMQYLAKSSVESIFEKVLGVKAMESVSHLVWNVSLPKY